MKKKKVLIAHNHSSIEIMHSLVPLYLLSRNKTKYDIEFVDYKFLNLRFHKGDVIILTRKYHNFDHNKKINREFILKDIKEFRRKFKKVIYFDDSAAVSYILFFILPYVDSYWVRGLLIDKSNYEKAFYGGRSYSDYYYSKYGVKDKDINLSPDFKYNDDLKIKIAWNIGIGCFPVNKNNFLNRFYFFIRRFCCVLAFLSLNFFVREIIFFYIQQMKNYLNQTLNLNKKSLLISARFSYKGYSNSVGFNRKLISKKIKNNTYYITGKLDSWKYIKECSNMIAMLSPFGWGEICYRDFEAILHKCLLVKPDMDHLETWPNIYKNDFYLKLDWDFVNLSDVEKYINKNKKDIKRKIENSIFVYLNALEDCSLRAEALLDDILY